MVCFAIVARLDSSQSWRKVVGISWNSTDLLSFSDEFTEFYDYAETLLFDKEFGNWFQSIMEMYSRSILFNSVGAIASNFLDFTHLLQHTTVLIFQLSFPWKPYIQNVYKVTKNFSVTNLISRCDCLKSWYMHTNPTLI